MSLIRKLFLALLCSAFLALPAWAQLVLPGSSGGGGGSGCATTGCTYTGTVTFNDASTYGSSGISGLLGLAISGGTVTSSTPPLTIAQTWNNSGTAFNMFTMTATVTADNNNSTFGVMKRGTTTEFTFGEFGVLNINNYATFGSINTPYMEVGSSASQASVIQSTGLYGWSSGTNVAGACDTCLGRSAAGVVKAFGASSAVGNFQSQSFISIGSPPTLTGTCTTGSQVGGNTAGTFAATCVAQTVIMTFAYTAPNGWVCDAHDQSTPADVLNQTANSTTQVTLTGTTVASDSIAFKCMAF